MCSGKGAVGSSTTSKGNNGRSIAKEGTSGNVHDGSTRVFYGLYS
jgi:hypothetical protein